MRYATLKDKLSLVLVCRTFQCLAERFLYERFICHDIERTIESLTNGDRGRYVRDIVLAPQTQESTIQITPENMRTLYRICYNLESIFVYPMATSWAMPLSALEPSCVLNDLPPTVSHVGWDYPDTLVNPTARRIQAPLQNIRTLTLLSDDNIFVDEPLCLPHVKTFHVAAGIPLPTSPWTFPSLKNIRLVYCYPSTSYLRPLSTGVQRFLQSHAQKLDTMWLENGNPTNTLYRSDLHIDILMQCINMRLLLIGVGLCLFPPRMVQLSPLWPALQCVVLVLDGTHRLDIPIFMRNWNGFRAYDRSSGFHHFVVLHPHITHDTADLERIRNMCQYDDRFVFQCESSFGV